LEIDALEGFFPAWKTMRTLLVIPANVGLVSLVFGVRVRLGPDAKLLLQPGSRPDCVVPLAVESVTLDVNFGHLPVADFDASRIVVAVDIASHSQTGAGFG
jgi:hypothetical protein